MKLQVPENFILLAFCTRSRQRFQFARGGLFNLLPHGVRRRLRHTLCSIFLASLSLIAFSSCVKFQRHTQQVSGQTAPTVAQSEASNESLVNINTASPEELEKLPGIGKGLAARIVAHRNEYGRFRRVEHLMTVRGISERRFRAVRAIIIAE